MYKDKTLQIIQDIIEMEKDTKTHYIIQTESLQLRPYCKKYVAQYHSWFTNDQQLLYLTGSQPLSYEQQLQNHKSWLTDPKKYTFLVFIKSQQSNSKLIGDVNVFFSDWIEFNEVEINIMLAVKQHRGKGYAKEIMQVIEKFVVAVYGKDEMIAKIKDDNKQSIRFFEKIGYHFVAHNERHGEVEYRKKLPIQKKQQLMKQMREVNNMREQTDVDELFGL